MQWVWIASCVVMVFAGIGVKWAIDRIWPPPPRMIQIEAEQPRPRGGEPRLTVLDDTMDVLTAGYEAGKHARAPSVLEELGIPAGVALPGGGWASGPCLDGPPTKRPADYPPPDGWAGLS